ncbi:unnamed protein product [Enterobius vermicularis]|uniref:C3H1-type domain-containing protein n=1 Tax=Enterobius vermicularis TaxID=51028 RepID=A0A0N4V7K0_ENTVE|nr:unnamed protein product [Enterobius vermicularis]
METEHRCNLSSRTSSSSLSSSSSSWSLVGKGQEEDHAALKPSASSEGLNDLQSSEVTSSDQTELKSETSCDDSSLGVFENSLQDGVCSSTTIESLPDDETSEEFDRIDRGKEETSEEEVSLTSIVATGSTCSCSDVGDVCIKGCEAEKDLVVVSKSSEQTAPVEDSGLKEIPEVVFRSFMVETACVCLIAVFVLLTFHLWVFIGSSPGVPQKGSFDRLSVNEGLKSRRTASELEKGSKVVDSGIKLVYKRKTKEPVRRSAFLELVEGYCAKNGKSSFNHTYCSWSNGRGEIHRGTQGESQRKTVENLISKGFSSEARRKLKMMAEKAKKGVRYFKKQLRSLKENKKVMRWPSTCRSNPPEERYPNLDYDCIALIELANSLNREDLLQKHIGVEAAKQYFDLLYDISSCDRKRIDCERCFWTGVCDKSAECLFHSWQKDFDVKSFVCKGREVLSSSFSKLNWRLPFDCSFKSEMTQDARDTEKSKSLIMNNHGNEKEVSNSAKVAHSKRSRSSRCPLQHTFLSTKQQDLLEYYQRLANLESTREYGLREWAAEVLKATRQGIKLRLSLRTNIESASWENTLHYWEYLANEEAKRELALDHWITEFLRVARRGTSVSLKAGLVMGSRLRAVTGLGSAGCLQGKAKPARATLLNTTLASMGMSELPLLHPLEAQC